MKDENSGYRYRSQTLNIKSAVGFWFGRRAIRRLRFAQ
jgi:hypothetical protein